MLSAFSFFSAIPFNQAVSIVEAEFTCFAEVFEAFGLVA